MQGITTTARRFSPEAMRSEPWRVCFSGAAALSGFWVGLQWWFMPSASNESPLESYLIAMRERDGTVESAQNLDDLWYQMSADERAQAYRELQMRPGAYDFPHEMKGE